MRSWTARGRGARSVKVDDFTSGRGSASRITAARDRASLPMRGRGQAGQHMAARDLAGRPTRDRGLAGWHMAAHGLAGRCTRVHGLAGRNMAVRGLAGQRRADAVWLAGTWPRVGRPASTRADVCRLANTHTHDPCVIFRHAQASALAARVLARGHWQSLEVVSGFCMRHAASI